MANFDKALDVLNWEGWGCGECGRVPYDPLDDCPDCEKFVTDAVKRLDNEGFLMPDLPEPNEGEWEVSYNVISFSGGHVLTMIDNHAYTPNQARELAYALLAAANHSEKEQDNG